MRVIGHLEGDAFGSCIVDGVRITEGQLEVFAFELDTVADAGELEALGVALGNAHDHVVDKGAGEAVHSAGLTLVIGAGDMQGVALDLDGQLLIEIILKGALGTLDGHVSAVDCHFDSSGNLDRLITDTRHGDLLFLLLAESITRRKR